MQIQPHYDHSKKLHIVYRSAVISFGLEGSRVINVTQHDMNDLNRNCKRPLRLYLEMYTKMKQKNNNLWDGKNMLAGLL